MGLTSSTCLYPGRCLMPAFHFQSECHTAEMVEEWEEEGAAAFDCAEEDEDPCAWPEHMD